MSESNKSNVDVLVIGGGNAALCAAISAREEGASVMLLEAAPLAWRGGNSVHTRNLRCMHDQPEDVLTETYSEEEFWEDLYKVTGGKTDETLARFVIRQSADCRAWMRRHGVHFQPSLSGTLHLSRTNAFFMGGGKALVNAYYRAAKKLGIDIHYETPVDRLEINDGKFIAAWSGNRCFSAKACVLAAGGFESNREWLREAWGQNALGEWPAENFIIRGTRYNRGILLKEMMYAGADIVGDASQSHCVAVDARSPLYDGGICTRVDCVSLGLVVNKDGVRFYDEGEDFWPKRYAIWGRLVAKQPGQIAYSIIDAKARGRFIPPVFPGYRGETLAEIARHIWVEEKSLLKTVAEFNAACRVGKFDHSVLDDCHTEGLSPPKTHWARPIDEPPFYAFPLRPGVTFTYMGIRVNERGAAFFSGRESNNLFVAGEMMAGNILGQGYIAGVGMTIGTVFGRIAGTSAARYALSTGY